MLRDVLHYLLRGLYLSAGATVCALLYALFTQSPLSIFIISAANFYVFFAILLYVGIVGFTSSKGRAARATDRVLLMASNFDAKREHQDLTNETAQSMRWFVMSLTPLLIGFLLHFLFLR